MEANLLKNFLSLTDALRDIPESQDTSSLRITKVSLLYDLLEILVGGFHCAVHFWPIWRKVVMFNIELRAEFGDHFVVEVGTIICDNPFEDAVSTDKIMLDESSHNILGNRCERGCFYPTW